jgi:hypothetical protein
MPRRGRQKSTFTQNPGYVDLLDDEDDFGVVLHDDGEAHTRSSHLHHEIIVDDYEPPDAWLPDDPTFALDDESGRLYDTELLREDLDFSEERVAFGAKRKRPRKQRSRVSVRAQFVIFCSHTLKLAYRGAFISTGPSIIAPSS